jgi:hypothetical protein
VSDVEPESFMGGEHRESLILVDEKAQIDFEGAPERGGH